MNRASILTLLLFVTAPSRILAQNGPPGNNRSDPPTWTYTSLAKSVGTLTKNVREVIWQIPAPVCRAGNSKFDWTWLANRCDRNKDGTVAPEELAAPRHIYDRLDRNWDGKLNRFDFDWTQNGSLDWQKDVAFALFRYVDRNSDGQITAEEWQEPFTQASRESGVLNDTDLEQLIFQPLGEMRPKRQQTLESRARDRLGRLKQLHESGRLFTDGPEVGELAPDFVLKTPDGNSQVRLSNYRGKKPVALIFGSFT